MLARVARKWITVLRAGKGAVHTTPFYLRTMAEKLNEVPDVEIEDSGTFKYILIQVYAQDKNDQEPTKLIVRGGQAYGPYHGDIYDATLEKLQKLGLDSECLGGGRICHEPENKKIKIYGYSQGFGKADHEKSAELLKKKFKDYDITWNDSGY